MAGSARRARTRNTAAAAARTARDAANDAADHAERAAAAADWAVQYAGQALEYANKSTEFANEASKAAKTATEAVGKAVEVEKAAREAEWQRLDQDAQQSVAETRLLKQIEDRERAELAEKRTQAAQDEQAHKDLIVRAESALRAGDTNLAAALGRKAAVTSMRSKGTWSLEAARFALAGTDSDIHVWIDTDRQIAQRQDDRETSLYLARTCAPDIADAAAKAVASSDPEAATKFLVTGAIQAAATDNRVQVGRVLAGNPGKAVKLAATEALNAGTPQALYEFINIKHEAAQREDDSVATAALIATGGRYTKAHAQAALEGPAWIRRNFIASVQYKTALLDFDSATHIAAMQGAIAAAAKIAYQAEENAHRAQQAAANARDAATDAQRWADKAIESARQAETSRQQANTFANDAEKSAASAQASADRAKQAAAAARTAARSANYSASRALDSARSAVASANSAQSSAASAHASALQAGKDAREASAAASQAHQIAQDKRTAEIAAAAKQAAEEARTAKGLGKSPADSAENDTVKTDVPWYKDVKWWANATNYVSIGYGFISAGLGIAGIFFPPLEAVALGFGIASVGMSAISTVLNGFAYGWTSSEFQASLGGTALGLITFGQSQWIGALGKVGGKVVAPVATKITQFGHDLISPVTSLLSLF
ncbi:hypothetical protein ACIQF5_31065 [Streptomyces goshikiensis]|uniref:ALF repeat-containing protein n=1 Tax=Streptomyces goshikiensis TaxID=1942 RepID=UPI0037F1F1D0